MRHLNYLVLLVKLKIYSSAGSSYGVLYAVSTVSASRY
uniref:Uncharacterized protein n=1 Tax=Arundo donax TaxID=35708 RepID=A0A0A9AKN0_ARUDO